MPSMPLHICTFILSAYLCIIYIYTYVCIYVYVYINSGTLQCACSAGLVAALGHPWQVCCCQRGGLGVQDLRVEEQVMDDATSIELQVYIPASSHKWRPNIRILQTLVSGTGLAISETSKSLL